MSADEYWDSAFRTRASTLPNAHPSRSSANLQAWDVEAAAVLRLYHNILNRRNALCIATTLPPEIISSVFRELAHIRPPGTTTKLGWLSTTHVCKTWRDAALADSYLWSLLPAYCPRLWDMFIARSSNMLLTVCGELPYAFPRAFNHQDAAGLLMSHIRRVVELELVQIEGQFLTCLVQKLGDINYELPQLKTLSLACGHSITADPLDVGLGRNFFATRIPNVRTLKMLGVPFVYRVSLPNLRHLHVRKNTSISVYEMLEVLRGLANLESLTLDQAARYKSAWRTQPPGALPTPLALPRLVDLCLLNSLHDSMFFATMITPSPDAFIQISSPREVLGDTAGPTNALVEFVRNYANRSQRFAMSNVSLCFPSRGQVLDGVGRYRYVLSLRAEEPLAAARGKTQQARTGGVEISFNAVVNTRDDRVAHRILLHALTASARSEWNQLHLSGGIEWSSDSLHKLLREAFNLRALHLEDLPPSTMRSFFDALNPMIPSHDTLPALLPLFQRLILDGLDFDHLCKTCSDAYPHSSHQQLEDMLGARWSCDGAEVPSIVVTGCEDTVLEEHVERWSEYCQVDWKDSPETEDEDGSEISGSVDEGTDEGNKQL